MLNVCDKNMKKVQFTTDCVCTTKSKEETVDNDKIKTTTTIDSFSVQIYVQYALR